MREYKWKLSDEIYCLGLYKKKQNGLNIEKDIIYLNKRQYKRGRKICGIKNIKRKISQIEYIETNGFHGIKKYSKKTYNVYNDFYTHDINTLFLISNGLFSINK